jgi:hypothetical protein
MAKKTYTDANGTYSLDELVEITGLPRITLYRRLERGWSIERALNGRPEVRPGVAAPRTMEERLAYHRERLAHHQARIDWILNGNGEAVMKRSVQRIAVAYENRVEDRHNQLLGVHEDEVLRDI